MTRVGHKELIAMLQRFQSRKEYAALRKSCKSAVSEWRWATSLMLPELPHDDIVRGFKPPKWAKKQPRYGSLHGLDANGRIWCIRGDDLRKPDERVHEQFLIHEDNGFSCIYFDDEPKKKLLAVKWYEVDGDRWLRSLEIGPYGVREYVLNWEGNRLLSYVDRSWREVSASEPKAVTTAKLKEKDAEQSSYSYSYSADGQLERVTEEMEMGDGDPPLVEVEYQRVPKGLSLDMLLQQAEDLLVAEIPKTIRAAKVKETVYGLLLQFSGVDTDTDGFAPPLYLPAESLRRRLLSEHPKEAPYYLWAVPEWDSDPALVQLNCKNAALHEKLHLIYQLTIVQPSPPNYTPVRKMIQRVCARLNALDWKGTLKTTDDFVVIPFDTHGEFDRKVDLKASVPVEKLRLLMDRGYIGRMKLK
jgi:hypothetical protein